jgi:Transcriptional regulator, AbiEi antitoxin/Protein of unknown function (DUF559)
MRITPPQAQKSASPLAGEHADALIVAQARQKHGVIGRTELLALGVSDNAIAYRVAIGRLFRIHRGVYSIVPPSMLSRNGRYMAAVLAGTDGALVSFRPAAALQGLRNTPAGLIDITIPGPTARKISGVRVHSSRCLDPADRDEIEGIPCTTWARTIVDLAAIEPRTGLVRLIERAQILQLFDGQVLDAAMTRANGKKGVGALRAIFAELHDDPPHTASAFERDFLFFTAEYGLPTPIVNGWVLGYQVDFQWEEQKLIVEADDRTTHSTPIAFERDRERDLVLELAGWHVLRVSARQLRQQPGRVAALIAGKLGLPIEW